MMEYVKSLTSSFKVENILGYVVIVTCVFIGHSLINNKTPKLEEPTQEEEEEEEEEDPLRNFTLEQLKHFDGKMDEKLQELKSVYLALNGTVFDVSKGRDFYGEGGPYENFAGHECGVALAKMSFDTEYLDDIAACEKLSFGERDELDNWMQKFEHYRCYPIKGKLVAQEDMPDPTHVISKEELSKHNGEGEVPAKYATAPIYVGAGNKVYDVSFGGVEFYGKGCGYNLFAGRDASRALALVSLDPKEAMNPDISDLDEKRIKVLNDWIKTFSERKKYPVVGVLGK